MLAGHGEELRFFPWPLDCYRGNTFWKGVTYPNPFNLDCYRGNTFWKGVTSYPNPFNLDCYRGNTFWKGVTYPNPFLL